MGFANTVNRFPAHAHGGDRQNSPDEDRDQRLNALVPVRVALVRRSHPEFDTDEDRQIRDTVGHTVNRIRDARLASGGVAQDALEGAQYQVQGKADIRHALSSRPVGI